MANIMSSLLHSLPCNHWFLGGHLHTDDIAQHATFLQLPTEKKITLRGFWTCRAEGPCLLLRAANEGFNFEGRPGLVGLFHLNHFVTSRSQKFASRVNSGSKMACGQAHRMLQILDWWIGETSAAWRYMLKPWRVTAGTWGAWRVQQASWRVQQASWHMQLLPSLCALSGVLSLPTPPSTSPQGWPTMPLTLVARPPQSYFTPPLLPLRGIFSISSCTQVRTTPLNSSSMNKWLWWIK